MRSPSHSLIPFLSFLLNHLTAISRDSLIYFFSQSRSYDRWSVGQSILVSRTHFEIKTRFLFSLTVAGFLMWDAISDERTGMSFTMYNVQYIYILHVMTWIYMYTVYTRPGILVIKSRSWSNRKHRFHRYTRSSTIPRLLVAYSLPREPVYRVFA
jgi:hypothetical protein